MNEEVLGSLHLTNQLAQAQVLQYFEQLKAEDRGWEQCANALLSGHYNSQEQIRFFCYQVLEHFAQSRYPSVGDSVLRQNVHAFLVRIFAQIASQTVAEKAFIRNKLSQVVALVFVADYPTRWPTFFSDLLQFSAMGPNAVDLYLRILKAIDVEVVDREVAHSPAEQQRNTAIKDYMRGQCVSDLVSSWYSILTTCDVLQPELVCLCLEVVGLYVAWIDINLIANDRIVPILIQFLKMPLLRESACDCVTEIVHKGMDPGAKIKLIESFTAVLKSTGVIYPEEDEDGDFVVKLAKLVNEMGENLVAAWTKSVKGAFGQEASTALSAIEGKIPLLFRYLGDDDDDVSSTVFPFLNSYIGILKQLKPLTEAQKENIEQILLIVIKKLEYSADYDFDTEGEDEAMFQEYRTALKVIFNAIAKLNSELVLATALRFLQTTLSKWNQISFREVEVSLLLVYALGEALPTPQNQHFRGDPGKATALQEMMKVIIDSGVSHHQHQAVSLQYFETIVRYEKFFQLEPIYIKEVLASFLDKRGLHHKCSQVRSRASYLFTRFIRAVRSNLQHYAEAILEELEGLLVLNAPYNGCHVLLTNEEQMFLYEVASQLIVSSDLTAPRKLELMRGLLQPVLRDFEQVYQRLCSEADEKQQQALAECLNCAMSFATRSSKGFTDKLTMKSCGCQGVFTSCLEVFMRALNSPFQRSVLQQGVRQFFHRMVVCLEEDVLPFVPSMVELLLQTSDVKELYDLIPMLNQLISKFKRSLEPYLREVFMPLVNAIFTVLRLPVDERDTVTLNDRKMLRRGYFSLVHNLVTCELGDVIRNQEGTRLEEVLMTIIYGAAEIPDPTAQKHCFVILKKLIELWGGKNRMDGFDDFIQKSVVPACIKAPVNGSFDWSDAQSVLVVGDIAACLKAAHSLQGILLISWLQNVYFPSVQLSPSIAQEFCIALADDSKKFKDYLKDFYDKARAASS